MKDEPAFPQMEVTTYKDYDYETGAEKDCEQLVPTGGLSKREYFATKFIPKVAYADAEDDYAYGIYQIIAKNAVLQADALITALEAE